MTKQQESFLTHSLRITDHGLSGARWFYLLFATASKDDFWGAGNVAAMLCQNKSAKES
jgi:hypothetical protein